MSVFVSALLYSFSLLIPTPVTRSLLSNPSHIQTGKESLNKLGQSINTLKAIKDEKNELSKQQQLSSPSFQQSKTNNLAKLKNIHHSERFNAIDSYFNGSQPANFPVDVSKIIGEYDFLSSYSELYKDVINGLELTENDRNSLEFEDRNFSKNLYKILIKRKTSISTSSIPKIDIVRHGLPRLIYKWSIYIADTFKKEADSIFDEGASYERRESLQRIQGLEMMPPMPYSLENLLSRNTSSLSVYRGFDIEALFASEILDSPYLIDVCDEIFREFYHQSGDSKIILEKYFDGDWDNNFLLRKMIYEFDSFGELRCRMFSNNKDDSQIIPSTEKYPLESIMSEIIAIIDNFHNFECTLDICRRNNLRMQIKNSDCFNYIFVKFARSDYFKNSNSINMDTLKNILGFPDQWDQEKYREYVNDLKMNNRTLDTYKKLLEKGLVLEDELKNE